MQTSDQAREEIAAWMIRHGLSTGHGDTVEQLLAELGWQLDELVRRTALMHEALVWVDEISKAALGEGAHRPSDEALMEIWVLVRKALAKCSAKR